MKTKDPIQRSAKTAGLAYLIIILTSILSMAIGPYKLMVEGDIAATIQNISTNPLLYRAGAVYDLLMFMGVIILSVALFTVLKTENRTTALTALISRIGEAFFGCLSLIISIIILLLINSQNTAESVQNTVALLFDIKDSIMNIVFTFLGFGSVLFCYLFYVSGYIPKLLAGFGILAFLLVFVASILVILFSVESTVFTGIPAILFEITIGVWLLVKGVKVEA